MKRTLKVALGVLLGLVALLLLIIALLGSMNWNQAKPWISEKVSQATGRSFSIDGDLSLQWEKPGGQQQGWRRFISWPHLRAQGVTVGNPEWASTGPVMARIEQIDVTLNPLALLQKRIHIPALKLSAPELVLERDKEGRNNWTFARQDKEPSDWKLELDNLMLDSAKVRLVDATKNADVTATIDSQTGGEEGINWKLAGEFDGEKVSGGGKAGALLSLRERGVEFPIDAELVVGDTEITAKGTLTEPAHLSALDLQLNIKGASMALLYPLTGILLPETPKFSTSGRVVGTVGADNTRLRYEKFVGRVGSSDIGGTLEYAHREPRPLLSGDVTSKNLKIDELTALFGPKNEEREKRGIKVKQPPDKVLPVTPFQTDRWNKVDVQVRFSGQKIIRAEALPLDNVSANVNLKNGVLTLAPLKFGVAGGQITSQLQIDSTGKPVKAQMTMTARRLKLKQMFPKVQSMRASFGEVNADAKLTGAGNSFAALLGSSNGEVKSVITEGSISKVILEAMGLNLGSVVVAQLFGDRQVQLNCMAADFVVNDGLMQTKTFVVDTQDATININGKVNFAKEVLDLNIKPESKGVRIISLRSPLYVSGTFKDPDVGVDKGAVAMKAGAAVVLGTAVAPLAALLALINPGPGEEAPCPALLAQAQKKPEAPPPEKATARNPGNGR
ncbi:AsmA family protein [Noviherbaspirillum sp.]|uniref:AsmA family protein n=1 Tax=Noviherbaspirillum sp. TaxID=1926288 RepID=UPI002FE2B7F8